MKTDTSATKQNTKQYLVSQNTDKTHQRRNNIQNSIYTVRTDTSATKQNAQSNFHSTRTHHTEKIFLIFIRRAGERPTSCLSCVKQDTMHISRASIRISLSLAVNAHKLCAVIKVILSSQKTHILSLPPIVTLVSPWDHRH